MPAHQGRFVAYFRVSTDKQGKSGLGLGADRLLGPAVADVDGNIENRNDTVSVFNGPPPTVHSLKSESEEIKSVSNWITDHAKSGVLPHEFGVFVRSEAQLDRARAAAKKAGLAFKVLDDHVETSTGQKYQRNQTSK
jgi:hypothetical protein